jgi:3-deoxy-D-manno-octulosonic-acid transferase
LPALDALRGSVPDLRAVIAPHEPDRAHVERLLGSLGRSGWTTRTLEDVERSGEADGVDAIVVERVGVLAHLYAVATVSFVGGGFHDAGLHSVLEPAAAASPVVFGPRHHNTRAAGDLLADGGARVAASAQDLCEIMGAWLLDESARNDAAAAAARYIEGHRGAAARSAEHIADLIAPAS